MSPAEQSLGSVDTRPIFLLLECGRRHGESGDKMASLINEGPLPRQS